MDNPKTRAGEHTGNQLKEQIWRTIFLSDTPASKTFDVILLWMITASVGVIMLESVDKIAAEYAGLLHALEWGFTILFTIEYAIRIWVVRKKLRYLFSFFGIVDLLSILPTYLMLIFANTQFLAVIRILRLLRMFRVLKMARHMGEANVLWNALRASRAKITVFMFGVVAITTILGTVMYVVEGELAVPPTKGFNSIPASIYWAIVTIATVGYGNVVPVTVVGKMITTVIILIGYAIIAVPTGIVTAELNQELNSIRMDRRECDECGIRGHDPKARFCKGCGKKLSAVA
ncbi:MAG: ion transporter [Verrucomicrobiales bacterium]|nr:ion transporter [Verrucomicrobiales bacterium]